MTMPEDVMTGPDRGPRDGLGARRIDHVGVVVRDLTIAADHFSTRYGLTPSKIWDDPDGRFRLAYLEAGDTTLQLVQPGTSEGLRSFLRETGEGLHHVCFAVDDLDDAVARSPGGGLTAPYLGGRGTRVCFLADTAHGVRVELTEILAETGRGTPITDTGDSVAGSRASEARR
jgi:methylmalonyl-CoA/ethylmalonyl-CoA epimerase